MAIVVSWPMVLEENADSPPVVFTYYPNGVGSAPYDWTGWTAQAMFRQTPQTAVALTVTVALGGTAGTVTIPSITAAQASSLAPAMPGGVGVYDVVCTNSATGFKLRFVDVSPVQFNFGVTK